LLTGGAVETDLLTLRQDEQAEVERQQRLASAYEDARQARDAGVRGMRRLSVTPISNLSSCRQRVVNIISWWLFDALIGVVIMCNSVTIGIETTHAVQELPMPQYIRVLENCFLAVYMVELSLRFYGIGCAVLRSNWVKFDCFLVVCGVMDLIYKAVFEGTSAGILDQVMLIRMLRMLRLIRAVRLVVQFRTLYLLISGLAASMLPMMWVCLVCILMTYIFSILGMEVIHVKGDFGEEYRSVARTNFLEIGDSMLMLVQLIFMDSAAAIYRPLLSARPELSLFFVPFILLGSISLMNLVTAITVESALRQAGEDQEAKKAWEQTKRKELVPKLRALFAALDVNCDGEVELAEIQAAPAQVKDQLLRICNMDDLEEIFQMLDYDDSGGLDIEEFCTGIIRTQADKPPELLRIMRQCTEILRQCRLVSLHVGVPPAS